ncbi:MAG: hypothetical protein QXV17_07410 [Candidatus Micrarchaeaceae archaeon]
MKNNGFKKEYVIGKKDQLDIDYKTIMKRSEVSKTKEQCFESSKENMNLMITKVSSKSVEDLIEEMELV